MGNVKKGKKELRDIENRLAVATTEGWGESRMDEGGNGHKLPMSWECKVHHSDYS